VARDGSVYFTDGNYWVWRVNPNGIVERVAGRYNVSVSPPANLPLDYGDPLNTYVYPVVGMALTPDDSLFLVNSQFTTIMPPIFVFPGRSSARGALAPIGTQNIPSEDASEVYVFDPAGRHLETLDSLTGAAKWAFGYDTNSLVVSITDLAGLVTRIERDASGRAMTLVGPYGQRTSLAMDANGFLSAVTNPANETTSLTNSSGGLLLSITGPRGETYRVAYDSLGRATRVADPLGGGWTDAYSDLGIQSDDGYQVAAACTNSLGDTLFRELLLQPNGDTYVSYSLDGDPTETGISYVNGDSASLFSDGPTLYAGVGADPRFGSQAQQEVQRTLTLPNGLVYQARVQRTAGLTNPVDPFSFTGLTNVTTINGKSYTEVYNPTNQTFTSTSPMGRTSNTTLDPLGRPIQISAPGWPLLNITYDNLGRVAAVTSTSSVAAEATTFAYDSLGQLRTLADALGRTNTYAYDAAGRLQQQTMADGSVVGFTHDSEYNLTSVTPPGRPAHTFEYNAVGLLTKYTPPLAGGDNSLGYQYDSEQQLTQVNFPDGQTTSFQRGQAGRIDAQTLGSGESLSYAYGAVIGSGFLQLTSVSSSRGNSLEFGYCGSILTNVAWSGTVTGQLAVQLNADLMPSSLSVDGSAVALSYDKDLMLTNAGGLGLTRDPATGFITATSLGGVADNRVFDDRGLLTNYVASLNNTSLWSMSLSYDLINRLTNKVETLGGVTRTVGYVYDLAGRLAQVWQGGVLAASYTYDANGNRLTCDAESATYDVQDRVQTYAGTTFGWSPNGNLQSQTNGNQVTTYTYDLRGHLTAVGLPDGTQLGYILDPAGNRVGKTITGVLNKGWLWSGAVPVAEVDSNSRVTARFVFASRPNVPDYIVKGASTFRVLSDERGSVRLVVNTADGSVAQELDYDEFGRVLADTAPGFQPFGFAGGLYDPDSGLVRFGVRDFDAFTGQWTSRDPLGFGGGSLSLYAYVNNDPLNYVDPLGVGPFATRMYKAGSSLLGLAGNAAVVIGMVALLPEELTLATAGVFAYAGFHIINSGWGVIANGFNLLAVAHGPDVPLMGTSVPGIAAMGMGNSPNEQKRAAMMDLAIRATAPLPESFTVGGAGVATTAAVKAGNAWGLTPGSKKPPCP
jgi:RHS repeat-associated protein